MYGVAEVLRKREDCAYFRAQSPRRPKVKHKYLVVKRLTEKKVKLEMREKIIKIRQKQTIVCIQFPTET